MAECVIHALEAIEIDEQHGDRLAGLPAEPRDRVFNTIEEETSVRETGERVVKRTLTQLVIEASVLDRHRRLERERSGERKSTIVDRAKRGGRQLRESERITVSDERKQQHRR